MKVIVETTDAEKTMPPRQFVAEAIDPELDAYQQWLASRDQKGPLAPFERDLLRSYLWFRAGR